MNRNNERHFNQVPELHASRTRFKRDQDIKTTLNAGQLVPIFVDEVLPGDTYDVDLNGIVRMATPIYPVMDNLYLDVYAFFVPNRIVWDHWKEFMGEASDQPWTPSATETIPQLKITNTQDEGYPEAHSLLDYFGVPTKIENDFSINALPIRGYVKIWNEWFRDQNSDNPATVMYDDAQVSYPNAGDTTEYGKNVIADTNTRLKYANTGRYTLPVNKFHDRFTSALPAPQRGDQVQLPLLNAANNALKMPVNAYAVHYDSSSGNLILGAERAAGTGQQLVDRSYNSTKKVMDGTNELKALIMGTAQSIPTTDSTNFNAYMVDASPLASGAAATINALREAFQVQKFLETSARSGSRYRELVRGFFNVTLSDKTVQIPEYLGGDRFMINVQQVVQTSSTDESSPQGNAAAISVTPFRKHICTKSFEEHGFFFILGCIRHDRTYQQGLEPMWSRKERLDYYFPVFAHLGEQAILNKEIFLQGVPEDDQAFGYQEAWSDYRMKPNIVTGAMRSNYTGTLDAWHYADNYDGLPTLSSEWLKEGDTEVQRTLAVQDEPQFIADFLVNNKTTRVMPLYSVPGLIDHM